MRFGPKQTSRIIPSSVQKSTRARQEMKRRKVKRNVLSFDDMLTRLDEALSGEWGEVLACAIRERFKAALVQARITAHLKSEK